MIVLGGAWLELFEREPDVVRALEDLDDQLREPNAPEHLVDQARQRVAREILDLIARYEDPDW